MNMKSEKYFWNFNFLPIYTLLCIKMAKKGPSNQNIITIQQNLFLI